MRDQRHWLVRFSAELLVLALLAGAAAAYAFDLGERWFGWGPIDPATQPAAVLPPEGLRLPAAKAAPAVAEPGTHKAVDPAKVAASVAPLLRKRVLGPHVSVLVTDLASGRAVYRAGTPMLTPASTTKLLTSTAILETLGPMARFRTTVRFEPGSGRLVLVGGGDPFLASTPDGGGASYPERADVATLARAAAARLKALGVPRVRLAFDDSYFSGPDVNPAWPAAYVPDDVVPPISALWVDEGRDPSGSGFVEDPAAVAAQTFRAALRGDGVKVGPQLSNVVASPTSRVVASVRSAPLGEIVERTLAVSDNEAAEVLSRHVGLAERQEGSFVAGTAATLDVVRRLGVSTTDDRLYDGSGLSRRNLLRSDTLAGVLRTAEDPAHPELRPVLTGLPVAGFTGSLAYRFDQGPEPARGRVRAKTGTLTGVHGLAGVADDVGGAQMAFVVVADRVRDAKSLEAQVLVDRIAGALGACRCDVGSSS